MITFARRGTIDRSTSSSSDSSKALRLRCPSYVWPRQLAQHSGVERPPSTADATSVWYPRMSTQSKATSSGFLRRFTSRATTPRMASAGSTRSLAQNRQQRLIWCLASPGIRRPRLASDTRSTRMAEATRAASVLAWDSRSETARTETTHAVASVRRMIDSFKSIVTGWPTRARDSGLGLFLARREKASAKPGMTQGLRSGRPSRGLSPPSAAR